MPPIKPRDMMVLDEVFEMQQGYVLNFSDRTMMQFFDAEFSIDIDDDKYRRFGHSKAKRLRAFFYIENASIVAKALRALWDYRDAIRGPFEENDENEKRLKKRFFEILARVEADNELPSTDPIEKFEANETLEELVSAIERDIQANKPAAALDRLHTYCMKKYAHLLEQHGIPFDKEEPLHSRAGKYVKAIEGKTKIRDISLLVMKSSISIFERFNQIRNKESLAHDNEIVDRPEARFVFDSITSILRFIKGFEANRFGN